MLDIMDAQRFVMVVLLLGFAWYFGRMWNSSWEQTEVGFYNQLQTVEEAFQREVGEIMQKLEQELREAVEKKSRPVRYFFIDL